MKFYVDRIVVKVHPEDGYFWKQVQEKIYRDSWFLVPVPDEMVTHDSDTNKAVITPEIMAFVISNVSDRTGWEIISCVAESLEEEVLDINNINEKEMLREANTLRSIIQ